MSPRLSSGLIFLSCEASGGLDMAPQTALGDDSSPKALLAIRALIHFRCLTPAGVKTPRTDRYDLKRKGGY
jgi:hypothetical protein